MKRRPILMTGALSAITSWHVAQAQPVTKQRAAVAIGVDKAGDLPKLRAAASGARQVSALLRGDGYDVIELFDDVAPVTVSGIFKAVDTFIQKGIYDQLVIYFAGHGFAAEYVEYWMLSDGTRNPNEVVSLKESVALARLYSGIPNVTFISDACRSAPRSLGLSGIKGGVIFPSSGSVRTSDVDQFMATLVGDPSFEVALADSASGYAGIYTTTLLSAFAEASADDVRSVSGVDVVPNRRLKKFLEREVPIRAQKVNIKLSQRPDAQVTSEDDVYIARARRGAAADPSETAATVRQLAAVSLDSVGLRGLVQRAPAPDGKQASAAKALDDYIGFTKSENEVAANIQSLERFVGSQRSRLRSTSFLVSGQAVQNAFLIIDGAQQEYQRIGDNAFTASLRPDQKASALVQFSDGTSTMLAAPNGYAGQILVAQSGVINVSYVPKADGYDSERLHRLHASVATAARFGVFRIERQEGQGKNSGEDLADAIRGMKAVDPTLGLYAAYAYFDVGAFGEIESVRRYMHGFLGFDFFDTAMLSPRKSTKEDVLRATVPLCPMLAQGWALLRANKVRLIEELEALRRHLRPSLWTTFEPAGTELLLRAMRQGRLRT